LVWVKRLWLAIPEKVADGTKKAIAEKVDEALLPLAYLLHNGGLPDDAIPYYELAAAAGEVDAMVGLGMLLCDRGDDAGTRYVNEAMECGSIAAAFALGNYREMTDPPGSVPYYEKAAQ
jgi:TPR repeat protein